VSFELVKIMELAKKLHGREYLEEITEEEAFEAKRNRLVVVFGASDDLMEFRGAVDDEVPCYEGGDAFVTEHGLFVNICECDDCPYHKEEIKKAKKITALWNKMEYSFVYVTDILHESFDIMEGDIKYCKGIVFSLDRL